jgi:hypothetical protein
MTFKQPITAKISIAHTNQIHILKDNLILHILEKNRVRIPLS